MLWINAYPYVTLVKDAKVILNFSVVKLPRNYMSPAHRHFTIITSY